MNLVRISRRCLMGASLAIFGTVPAMGLERNERSGEAAFSLEPRPVRVFKTRDRSHEQTESWIFSLFVQSHSSVPLVPLKMKSILLRRAKPVQTAEYPASGFGPLTYHSVLQPRMADGRDSPVPIYWPFVVRLWNTEPTDLDVDEMQVEITAGIPGGATATRSIRIPIERYGQRARLIFPFHGHGIILQGGATNGGHRNRSGAYALDAMWLNDSWSVEKVGDGKKNTDYPGWGQPLLAPADGVVVRLRSDRPDQPVGDQSNPQYFTDEFRKLGGGDPGNHLVIDHGSGEFSMIAHFMAGSMAVTKGESVRQGKILGRLGHSGDTSAPHVHYQLQSGPDWQYADALPVRFSNVDAEILDRGTYFTAS